MTKLGILGGGQLGKMMLQAAANYPVETYVMENDKACPSAHLCHHFIQGEITQFDDVYNFGKQVDVLTIEIENVNIAALEKLEQEGIRVVPKPHVLKTIKNKITQKEYYKQHSIPSPEFITTENKNQIPESFLPAVHKIAEGGYDGKGVVVMNTKDDIQYGFDGPAVLEKKVKVKKEIAQMVAIDEKRNLVLYPPVEMVFDPYLNLLDYQICPATVSEKVLWKIEAISIAVAKNFDSAGLFAIELLIDEDDEVYVNETAPRVHNSGHHTIEAHYCSQFDMLVRILLNYPLGNTNAIMQSIMINLIGAEGHSGAAVYQGLEEALQVENCFVHIYGKAMTKPGRKMGHVTIATNDKQDLHFQANKIKNLIKIITA